MAFVGAPGFWELVLLGLCIVPFLAGVAALVYLALRPKPLVDAATILCPHCQEPVLGFRGSTVLCHACREPVTIP
ncbi:MAG: hypothetical protein WD069_15690 [Planctomycetales bacterium]